MAVFIGATKKSIVYKIGKPYKQGKLWSQDIVEIDNGKKHYATDYAYKKSVLINYFKNYPTL